MAPSPQWSRGPRHSISTTAIPSAISNEPKTDISSLYPKPKILLFSRLTDNSATEISRSGLLDFITRSGATVKGQRHAEGAFPGKPLCPTFIEVDDLSVPQKLTSLMEKFKGTHFFGRCEIGVAGWSTPQDVLCIQEKRDGVVLYSRDGTSFRFLWQYFSAQRNIIQ